MLARRRVSMQTSRARRWGFNASLIVCSVMAILRQSAAVEVAGFRALRARRWDATASAMLQHWHAYHASHAMPFRCQAWGVHSEHATPRHAMPCHRGMMPCMPCHAMPLLCCATPCCATPCHATLQHPTLQAGEVASSVGEGARHVVRRLASSGVHTSPHMLGFTGWPLAPLASSGLQTNEHMQACTVTWRSPCSTCGQLNSHQSSHAHAGGRHQGAPARGARGARR